MQHNETSQIRWSEVLNRDPTPPSAFWPPLQLPSVGSLDFDTATPSKIVTGKRPRQEAYVVSMEDQELLDHFKEERRSVRSLRRFLEMGIGIDAIRASRVTSRRSSVGEGSEDLRSPSQRSMSTAAETEASFEANRESSKHVSLLDMLQASRVSTRSLPTRARHGEIAALPSNHSVLISHEDFPNEDNSKPQSTVIERRKGNWFITKTKCSDVKLAIKKKGRKLRRLLNKLNIHSHRLSKIKRKSKLPNYQGT